MDRALFSSEHEVFRDSARSFVEAEMVQFHADWEKQHRVPREVWLRAGGAAEIMKQIISRELFARR